LQRRQHVVVEGLRGVRFPHYTSTSRSVHRYHRDSVGDNCSAAVPLQW
jgi:hypothetical protein